MARGDMPSSCSSVVKAPEDRTSEGKKVRGLAVDGYQLTIRQDYLIQQQIDDLNLYEKCLRLSACVCG